MKKRSVYLDYAAATPVDPIVLQAMQPYFSERFYNPSSVYWQSRLIKQDLEEARATVAHWLGSKQSEIIFTAGATEANNLAISGILKQQKNSKAVISSIEHEAVLAVAKQYPHSVSRVNQHGLVDLDHLNQQIDENTCLVSIIMANNEIGTVQHLSEIAKIISEIRKDRASKKNPLPLYLHTDASQAANYLDLHVNRLGVDLLTLNGGKTYGPKQSGILYVKSGTKLDPLILGGGQEKGVRSGTENVAFAVGFAKALDIAQSGRKTEADRLVKLRAQLTSGLLKLSDKIEILGHKKQTLPNIVSFIVPALDGERAVMELDEMGVMVATGSACSALNDKPSHVITALGYSDLEASSTLRISLGRQTPESDIKYTLKALDQLINSEHVWLSPKTV